MLQKIPVLKVTDLYKSYGGVHVLVGLNLEIHDGELHALIGPNGAGKTTLFNVISGFIKASKGSIQFKGQEITTLPAFKPYRDELRRPDRNDGATHAKQGHGEEEGKEIDSKPTGHQ